MKKFILALDQGTTSSRAIVFDGQGNAVASAQQEFRQIFPQPGWVEHDANEIWASQLTVARAAIASRASGATNNGAIELGAVAAIGITVHHIIAITTGITDTINK